jgi:hypothetical protein
VRTLDLIASTAFQPWEGVFPSLEVARYFSCNMGWGFGGGWDHLCSAPTVIAYGSRADFGFRFRLALGVKHLIINVGEPIPLPEMRVGVSNPGVWGGMSSPQVPSPFAIPFINHVHLSGTLERITVIVRLENESDPLTLVRTLWRRWVRRHARGLTMGMRLEIVQVGQRVPLDEETLIQLATEARVKHYSRLGKVVKGTATEAEIHAWNGSGYWIPFRPDEAQGFLEDLPPLSRDWLPGQLRDLREDEFRASVGERIYALAMDPMHTEI